ncbi:ATP-binding protein [Mesorhizobium sp. ORM16]|uniref:ATP-binding protein n=1 Tax=Mesorhizobium sp. ORM16 TaxID=3376989 RepID=UPI0038578908
MPAETAVTRSCSRAWPKRTLLILDDWGPEKLNDEQRRDLLEIVEDRYEKRSTIVTSQIPVEHWYDMIGNPTIADAVLDRLVHNAYRIELSGESMRKHKVLPVTDATPA